MNRLNNGFALVLILMLASFLATILYGLSSLTSMAQSDISKKNDLTIAQNYANIAMLDGSNGGVAKILTFENSNFNSTTYGATLIESMASDKRILLQKNYFLPSCNGGPSSPSGFSTGLCSSESSTNNYSLPVLRVGANSSAVAQPCVSYSFISVLGGQNSLPLIDDGNSRYSFSFNTGDNSLCHQPNFTIELLNTEFQISANNFVNRARLYRVTVRSFGRNGKTQVTQQAYFYVRCPNSICQASLLNEYIMNF